MITINDKPVKIIKKDFNTGSILYELESSYFKWLHDAVSNPGSAGFNKDDMKTNLRLEMAIVRAKESKGPLELDNDDFKHLKSCVARQVWNVIDGQIVAFNEYIESLDSPVKR